LSETAIAFARSCSCGIETVIAFVGAKWVFLVQFSGAEVMPVSMVAVQGGRSGVVGFKVATLSLLLREKVRPARSQWLKIGVFTLAGRTFRGNAAEGAVLGEFFRANRPCAQVL